MQQTGTDVLKSTAHLDASLIELPVRIQALFNIARVLKNNNNTTQSKPSTYEELESIINQDSKDNSANTANENVDTKIGGWLQWLKDSVQLPTIFKRAESTMIANKIAHEEREYFNKTNDITNSSIDRALENISYNTNYTVASVSSRTLIGSNLNNSTQELLPNIAGTIMLFEVALKQLGLNISLGNKEQDMQLDRIASDILPALQMRDSLLKNSSLNEDVFEDDTLENGLLHLLFTNSSSNQLQGDIRENAPE